MKSNPRDPGRPEGLHYEYSPEGRHQECPPELAASIEHARPRLGRLASTILYFETIGSTNDEAVSRSAKGVAPHATSTASPDTKILAGRSVSPQPRAPSPEGLVIVADEQTAGRGRRGHTWFSPPGSGLYVSVVLAPAASVDPVRATTLLTLAAGVALADGIEAATGLDVDLKWPNDLQIARRKLGGILAETSGGGAAPAAIVVGYGINVLATAFPPELRDLATSLETEMGRAIDRHQLLAETLAALSHRYEDLLAGRFDAILDAWRRRAPGAMGARVIWSTNAGPLAGVTAGIDELGALLVKVGDRIERIVSGEVTWL